MPEQGPGAGKRPIDAAHARERMEGAMLELSGEIGYRAVTVDRLVARGEVNPDQYEREFGDLESCFAAAYEAEAEALCAAMLAAARRAPDWRQGIRSALTTILNFAAENPAVANALLREVHVVGGAALAKYEEVLEVLAAAIDEACDELELGEKVPETSSFVVGAVEGVIATRLARGDTKDLPAVAPELMYLIVASLLGPEAAATELDPPFTNGWPPTASDN